MVLRFDQIEALCAAYHRGLLGVSNPKSETGIELRYAHALGDDFRAKVPPEVVSNDRAVK